MSRLVAVCVSGLRVLAAAAILWLVFAVRAGADAQFEVKATVISSAGTQTTSVTVPSLVSNCPAPPWPRGGTIYEQGSDGAPTFTTFTSDSWPLAEVISCGLGVPLDPELTVTVEKTDVPVSYPESPLNANELLDTGNCCWAYPPGSTAGALPMIDTGGSTDYSDGAALWYYRPWDGESGDNNANDTVGDTTGTISITVMTPVTLDVSMTVSTNGMTVTPQAQVLESDGKDVTSDVSWQWSFGDGGSSTEASPSHTYSQAGHYSVGVLVKLASLDLTGSPPNQGVTVGSVPSATTPTTTNPGTGGTTTGVSPNGPTSGSGETPGAAPGTSTSTGPATPAVTTTSTAPASPTVASAPSTPAPKHRKATHHHRKPGRPRQRRRPPATPTRGAAHKPTSNGGGAGPRDGSGDGGSTSTGPASSGPASTQSSTTTPSTTTPPTVAPSSPPTVPSATLPTTRATTRAATVPSDQTPKPQPKPHRTATAPSTRSAADQRRHSRPAHAAPLSRPLIGLLVSAVVPPAGAAAGSGSSSASPANAPAARAALPTPSSPAVIVGLTAVLLVGVGVARELRRGRGPHRGPRQRWLRWWPRAPA